MATEADALTLIGFIILALTPTIASFALKTGRALLCFASAGFWAILGGFAYSNSASTWDLLYCLFWVSMGMVIVCALMPAILREQPEDEHRIDEDPVMSDIDRDLEDREHYGQLFTRGKPQKKRSKKSKGGKFRDTGMLR